MIIRVADRTRNFTVIPNSLLEDSELTWEARGLLCFLLSKPDNWTVSRVHLEKQAPNGQHQVRRILNELEDAGYLLRIKKQNARGQWSTECVVHDKPQRVEPSTDGGFTDGGFTDGGFTDGGKSHPLVRTDVSITDVVRTEEQLLSQPSVETSEYSQDFQTAWKAYPRKTAKKAAWKSWSARVKAGAPPEEMIKAAEHYALICKKERKEEKYILHGGTFFGSSERYRDFIHPPEKDWKDRSDNIDQDRDTGGRIDPRSLLDD